MATITAIQNGNWSDASTWDLNRVPDTYDDVYVGEYIVQNLPTNVTVKSLHNTIGYCKFTDTSTQIFNGDLFSGEGVEVLQMLQNNIQLYINGNVYGSMIRTNHDTYLMSRTQTIVINGNVTLSREDILWNSPASGPFHYNNWYLTINGNVTLNQNSKLFNTLLGNGNYLISLSVNGNSYFYDLSSIGDLRIYQQSHKIVLTFNGNVFLNSNNFLSSPILHSSLNTFTIYGDFEIVDCVGINFANIHDAYIYGNVKYHNKHRLNSLFYVKNNVYVHDDYKCMYAGDDSPILYCVPSVEYPNVYDVREGVPYADGQLVGKLETVEVNTSNTINVYPYAKRVI